MAGRQDDDYEAYVGEGDIIGEVDLGPEVGVQHEFTRAHPAVR